MYGRSLAIGGCFLALVIFLSALIFYLSLGPCPPGTFACDNGELCVPQRQKCNNHIDCADGSDENPIECGILYGSKELTNKLVGHALQRQQQQCRRHERLQQQQQQQQQQQHDQTPGNSSEQQETEISTAFNNNNNSNEDDNDDVNDEGNDAGNNDDNESVDGGRHEEMNEWMRERVEPQSSAQQMERQPAKVNVNVNVNVTAIVISPHTDTSTDNATDNGIATDVDDVVAGAGGVAGVGGGAGGATNAAEPNNATTICEISTYPTHCKCGKCTILYCDERARLTRIPQTLSHEVTNLMIYRSNLTLHAHALAHLTQLERLSLKYDNISHLPVGAFAGLRRLERLEIWHNNISRLAVGVLDGLVALRSLFIISNQLRDFPLAHLRDVPLLEWLMLSDNLLTLRNERFPAMHSLYELYLDFNRIEYVSEQTFEQLNNLHLLDLNGNIITHIHPRAFWTLRSIRDIRLTSNPIKSLSGDTFLYNRYLEALSLGHTPLVLGAHLLRPLNVSYLNLTGIRFESIDFDGINAIDNLKYIIFDRFYFCSLTPQLHVCKPNTDGVSSFRDLLSKPVLRYSAWIMATITLFGNLLVLWGRFIYRDENLAVTMVIRNLALADILMGFYLITIGTQDYRFRNEYHKVSFDWITSWQCLAVGTLAVTSSEVSMFILAFMSLERFLLIADPFRGHVRIGLRNIFSALLAIWCMGVGIAIAPIVVWWRSSSKFYGAYSGTCFPLHIQEPYPLGWQYSAFMFLGVNLFLLLMIALLYTALLISIWRTRKATPLSLLDCEFAVRFFFIVLTDVLCWAPIIAAKIWVFFNYNISDDIYAWLVVFILPLNSAVNPLLYTFTTPKYRNQILLRGWKKITAKRRPEPSNGMMATTTATATGSSNPDDSTGRAIPMVATH